MATDLIYVSIRDQVRTGMAAASSVNCFVSEDNSPQPQVRRGFNIIPGAISVPEIWAKHFAFSIGIYDNFPTSGASDANIVDSTRGLTKLAADLRPVMQEFAFGQVADVIPAFFTGQSPITQSDIGNGTVFQMEVFFEGRVYEAPTLV